MIQFHFSRLYKRNVFNFRQFLCILYNISYLSYLTQNNTFYRASINILWNVAHLKVGHLHKIYIIRPISTNFFQL